jgi:hypothetical protein|tara:strand:- start:291 stop:521 length:231 start_codon:yes stop_codon:yes gene_type:complete
MQKIINVIALASGLVSLSVVAGAGYLYVNKDTLVENARERVTTAVTEAVSGALPGLIDAAMPELPTTTGPAIPTLP